MLLSIAFDFGDKNHKFILGLPCTLLLNWLNSRPASFIISAGVFGDKTKGLWILELLYVLVFASIEINFFGGLIFFSKSLGDLFVVYRFDPLMPILDLISYLVIGLRGTYFSSFKSGVNLNLKSISFGIMLYFLRYVKSLSMDYLAMLDLYVIPKLVVSYFDLTLYFLSFSIENDPIVKFSTKSLCC